MYFFPTDYYLVILVRTIDLSKISISRNTISDSRRGKIDSCPRGTSPIPAKGTF